MLPINTYTPYNTASYGTSTYGYGTPVGAQYGMTQQYATPAPVVPQQPAESMNAIMVHGIEGARNFMVPKNSLVPLFDDEEDVFYVKTTDIDGMHQRIKKYRFYEELDGDVIDASSAMIEQKNLTFGDSSKDQERLDKIEKSIEDLAALVELQIEQSSNGVKEVKQENRNSAPKKTSNNK